MSRQTVAPKFDILGVDIDAMTIDQAINYIVERAAVPSSAAFYVVKPYVEFLDLAGRDAKVRKLLNRAELTLPDGVALQLAAKFLYQSRRRVWDLVRLSASIIFKPNAIKQPLPERFSGITMTWPLLEQAAHTNLRVFLVGSPHESSIEQTSDTIRRRLPGLNIVGTFDDRADGMFEHLMAAVQAKSPDLILVGTGFPRQEQQMADLVQRLPHGALIGEGGTFDYQSFGGQRRRAPKWLQQLGLEWLWRLIQEPSRARRQLAIPRFIGRVYRAGRQMS